MNNSTLVLFELFLPLLSFLILIFFGKRFGRYAHLPALFIIGVMQFISIYFFLQTFFHENTVIAKSSIPWFYSSNFIVKLGIYIDNTAAIMMLVVSLISFLVHLYSSAYMEGDPRYSRYFAFLGLFTFSMNGIVIADRLIMMYIFWELVGLSSYLLIGFWFEKNSAANASKKAFLVNRVGDI